MPVTVRSVAAEDARRLADPLADILIDCVESGASVSFMSPLPREEALGFWLDEVAMEVERGETLLFVAEEEGVPVGTVQLGFAMRPNQPHRADVKKLLVRAASRGRGIGEALMRALEEAALQHGRTVLVLDTASDAAERLYERMGWSRVGVVPDYALWPQGGSCDTLFMYKRLAAGRLTAGQAKAELRSMPAIIDAITIRPASEADLPGILAIYNDAVLTTTAIWNETLVDLDNRRAWLELRRAQGFPVLVAEAEGAVAGYASFGDFRPFDAYRWTVEHSVYVAAGARRQGIGRALVAALFPIAKSLGKAVMVGGIDGSNAASLAMHAALGFGETGRMPGVGRKFGRTLDLVLMQKQLG